MAFSRFPGQNPTARIYWHACARHVGSQLAKGASGSPRGRYPPGRPSGLSHGILFGLYVLPLTTHHMRRKPPKLRETVGCMGA